MNKSAVEKRIAGLEAAVARVVPVRPEIGEALAWAAWATAGELVFLRGVCDRAACGVEPTPDECLHVIEIEAGCTRKMLAGEPDHFERSRLEREAEREQTGWPR